MPDDTKVQRRARGGRPSDLGRVIAQRLVKDDAGREQLVDVTVRDRLLETLRMSGVVEKACSLAGIAVGTYYNWLKVGARANRDLVSGARDRSELTEHERECIEFLEATGRADAEGMLVLLVPAEALARGGQPITTVTERRLADGSTETVTKIEHARPDGAMIRWLLSHKYPVEFGDRLAITAGGVPVQVEQQTERAESLADSLEAFLEREAQEAAAVAKANRATKRKAKADGVG